MSSGADERQLVECEHVYVNRRGAMRKARWGVVGQRLCETPAGSRSRKRSAAQHYVQAIGPQPGGWEACPEVLGLL